VTSNRWKLPAEDVQDILFKMVPFMAAMNIPQTKHQLLQIASDFQRSLSSVLKHQEVPSMDVRMKEFALLHRQGPDLMVGFIQS